MFVINDLLQDPLAIKNNIMLEIPNAIIPNANKLLSVLNTLQGISHMDVVIKTGYRNYYICQMYDDENNDKYRYCLACILHVEIEQQDKMMSYIKMIPEIKLAINRVYYINNRDRIPTNEIYIELNDNENSNNVPILNTEFGNNLSIVWGNKSSIDLFNGN